MARQIAPFSDIDWPEVELINSYAIFMGYLSMGVRGLGLLVLTWTTVVLLGGFVSMLQMEDFWCLTAITLVQTAGVFDFLLKEKAGDVVNSLKGSLISLFAVIMGAFKKHKEPSIARKVIAFSLMVVQLLALVIVLCALAVLYVFGLYISTGISLWRLTQHDYGNADGGANLKPALDILYTLAVAQGVVYSYSNIYDLVARTVLVERVANEYLLEADLVSEYVEETVTGCMKDPSFARGRNLVTYAVDMLIESKSRYGLLKQLLMTGSASVGHVVRGLLNKFGLRSPSCWHGSYPFTQSKLRHSHLRGVRILGQILLQPRPHDNGQVALIDHLLEGSASFTIIMLLVETFGSRGSYSTDDRVHAARIVAHIAGSICLDQFPAQGRMTQCISSLLDTFEEYCWRPEGHRNQVPWEYEWDCLRDEEPYYSHYEVPSTMAAHSRTQKESDSGTLLQGYIALVVQGLRILQNLAINEDNCRVITNTKGLLSKTMVPLISAKIHGDHHDKWSRIAMESLEFMNQLMATLGWTKTTKMTNEISGNSQAMIFRILRCHKCHVLLKRQAAQVLLHLSPDTPPSIVLGATGSSSLIFLWILLAIFLLPDDHFVRRIRSPSHLSNKSSYTARLAGQMMQDMISSITGASDRSMLPSVAYVIGSLARTVAGAENKAYRIHAAMILEHLCENYTKDDENLKELKKAMATVMPEVLKEIVHRATTEGIQVVTEANNGSNVLLTEGPDLEQGCYWHDNNNEQESSSTHHQQTCEQHQGIQLHEALIDLCWTIIWEWLDEDQNLTSQFNVIAAKICSAHGMADKTFSELVALAV